MTIPNKHVAIVTLAILLQGCAAYNAAIDITQEYDGRYNTYYATAKNTGDSIIPEGLRVYYLVTDCTGNTLDEDYVVFDTILAGKHQQKRVYSSESKNVLFHFCGK